MILFIREEKRYYRYRFLIAMLMTAAVVYLIGWGACSSNPANWFMGWLGFFYATFIVGQLVFLETCNTAFMNRIINLITNTNTKKSC